MGWGHRATPDKESEQEKLTVTLVLFQPAESGAGETPAVMTGGVLSMLTCTLSELVTPALFVAVPGITWFAPSAVTVTGDGQLLTPTLASLHANVTVTLELFQPLALGAGLRVAVIAGGGGIVMFTEVVELPVVLRPSSTVRETVKVPAEE